MFTTNLHSLHGGEKYKQWMALVQSNNVQGRATNKQLTTAKGYTRTVKGTGQPWEHITLSSGGLFQTTCSGLGIPMLTVQSWTYCNHT